MADRWNSGSDAAYIKPRLIPDYALLPRDDSGGPEYQPYSQQFGDGGYVTGDKAHLSAKGGVDDPINGDQIDDMNRGANHYGAESDTMKEPKAPAKSVRMAKK